MKWFKLVVSLFFIFIIVIQAILIIESSKYGISATEVIRILILSVFIYALFIENKVGYTLCVLISIFGLFNVFYKINIRSDYPLMVITDPLFYYFFRGKTDQFFAIFLLRFPFFLYLTIIILCSYAWYKKNSI